MSAISINDEFVAELFAHSRDWVVISQTLGGHTVVKHPKHDIAIKCGRWVTKDEAEAQEKAVATLDPAIIYVPRVYGFFHDKEKQIGYLAMERIDGVPVDSSSDTHLRAVQTAIDYLATFERDFPGPLHVGTNPR